MEIIVNREPPPNLHPIWHRHFGFQSQASQRPLIAKASIAPAVAKMAQATPARPKLIHDNDGWTPTCAYRPHPGAPVGVRKQLGPHTWISTTVLPGDARYPVEFLNPTPAGGQA